MKFGSLFCFGRHFPGNQGIFQYQDPVETNLSQA
jgi:hypothetical protein